MSAPSRRPRPFLADLDGIDPDAPVPFWPTYADDPAGGRPALALVPTGGEP